MERPETRLLRSDWDDERGLQPAKAEPEVIALEEQDGWAASRVSLRVGLNVMAQEPTLVGWAGLARMLGGGFRMVPLFVLLFGLGVRLQDLSLETPESVLAWLLGTARWLVSPPVLVGTLGMLAVAWLAGVALEVAADSGVLGSLKRRLEGGAQAPPRRLFWSSVGERYLGLLGWSLLRAAVVLGWSLAGVGAAWAVWRVMGGLAPLSAWTAAPGLLGVGLVLGLIGALTALCVGAAWWIFLLALGPFIQDGEGLGESLWEGVRLLASRPAESVGLGLLVGALFATVWAVYVPFYGVSLAMSNDPQLAVAGAMLQACCDLLLAFAVSAASIWARGAAMGYVAVRGGALSVVPPAQRPSMARLRREARRRADDDVKTPSSWLPEETPNLIEFDALPL